MFDTSVPSTHVDTKATTFYDNGTSLDGSVTGDIKGNKINLTVTREGYTPLVLDGAIDAGNRAHGDYTYRKNESGVWDSSEEFSCAARDQGSLQQKNGIVFGGPVDIYNIATSETPDQYGHSGVKIGTLEDGQLVIVAPGGPCARDSWCKIVMPGDREHFGFVNGHIQFRGRANLGAGCPRDFAGLPPRPERDGFDCQRTFSRVEVQRKVDQLDLCALRFAGGE